MTRIPLLPLVAALSLALAPLQALAHKVVASAYPSGTVIEGQVGFSNGDMAGNARVEVFAPDGRKLGETTTDGAGNFTFTPTEPVAHEFRSDLGAGHQADFTVDQEDVEQVLGLRKDTAQAEAEQQAVPAASAGATGGVAELSMADKLAIAKMVRDEVRPLTREIAAMKEHNGIQSVIGGIGYIIGLFGIGFYVAGRRRKAG